MAVPYLHLQKRRAACAALLFGIPRCRFYGTRISTSTFATIVTHPVDVPIVIITVSLTVIRSVNFVPEGVPAGTKTLALIMDDPDAPMGTWVHWVVYNIPPVSRIEENSVPGSQGVNNFRKEAYGGPCPPSGTHRYFFKIYALDTELDLVKGAAKGALEQAMQGHVLEEAELIGLYRKK